MRKSIWGDGSHSFLCYLPFLQSQLRVVTFQGLSIAVHQTLITAPICVFRLPLLSNVYVQMVITLLKEHVCLVSTSLFFSFFPISLLKLVLHICEMSILVFKPSSTSLAQTGQMSCDYKIQRTRTSESFHSTIVLKIENLEMETKKNKSLRQGRLEGSRL